MKNIIFLLVILIVIGGIAYKADLFKVGSEEQKIELANNFGTYKYVCADNSEFDLTIANDMSVVVFEYTKAGSIEGQVLLSKVLSEEVSTYQNYSEPKIKIVGAGEEITLTTNTTVSCRPIADSENAPFNWGDIGEGGGEKQDVALIVSENILGKWQSIDDAKSVRVFQTGGVVIDYYNDKEVSKDSWNAYQKEGDDAVYIDIEMVAVEEEPLQFKLAKLTPEELELIYLSKGNTLRYKFVE